MPKYQKIIGLLDRCYLYPDPVGLTDSLLQLGPDAMVLNLHDKKIPYTGNERLEGEYRQQLHELLEMCDAAGVDSYPGCANISKHHNEVPTGIPTSDDADCDSVGDAVFTYHLEKRTFHLARQVPTMRAWNLPVEVHSGHVSLYWFRTSDPDGNAAAKYADVKPGSYLFPLHSLECAEWTLMIVAHEKSKLTVYAMVERPNPDAEEGHPAGEYLFRGPKGRSSWLECRSPELAQLATIAFQNKARMAAIKAEFGVHASLKSGFIFSDEIEGIGWTELFQKRFLSAGHGAATTLGYTVRQAAGIFGAPPIYFGDMFGHERTEYNRNNCPRGGGMSTTLNHLPATLPGIPVMWFEGMNEEKIFADLEGVARKGIPYLIGHQLGEITTAAILRTFDLCVQRNVPLPVGSFWFGWNRNLLNAEWIGREMREMPSEI